MILKGIRVGWKITAERGFSRDHFPHEHLKATTFSSRNRSTVLKTDPNKSVLNEVSFEHEIGNEFTSKFCEWTQTKYVFTCKSFI